jgi:multidrug resistance protein, MATE family
MQNTSHGSPNTPRRSGAPRNDASTRQDSTSTSSLRAMLSPTDAVPDEIVTRPTARQLLGLAWPIVVQRSAQVVISTTDALVVARLGQEAFGAVSAGGHNAFALLILPMGTVFIVSSFAAQLTGKGDHAAARRYAWYGLVIAALTQIACFLSLPFIPGALGFMSYPAGIANLMADYLAVRLLTGGAAVGLEALGNYYSGLKNAILPMVAQILAMVLNGVLDIVLVYGLWGAPKMGVRGAAAASAIATLIAFLFLFTCFLRQTGTIKRIVDRGSLQWNEFKRLVRFGLPSGLNWFVEFFAFLLFINVVIAGLGETELAAMLAVLQVNSVSFMPAFGLTSAGSIFVGQAIGKGAKDDVPPTVKLTMKIAAIWQGAVGIVYVAFPVLLLKPFVSGESAAFLAAGAVVMRLSASWQLFDAVANTLAEALRAAGDTFFCSVARSVIAWGIFFPGAWISARVFGGREVVATVWLVIYLALLAGVLWWRFRSGRWREIALTEEVIV